ncbi:HigA family addiction module antidote protein [Chlorobaculum thiosulfatiphilum]|uniref:HigA family addiction module antidote protein n=1 Tax=Chlorobaculum thiosulfatiphilum TaxID=115852 RepID=A0A5C4S535_CHLTI|nr:HigA family addiction module antitoxin [Chlorobaculum thiosulfatiphilum]TNJ38425.1 HigA family addiction module antidote protein [Chlorobaculum thiosulfatiphilum]
MLPRTKMKTAHPGEILSEEFLAPMQLSNATVAQGLNLPESEIEEILQGNRDINADTAWRLARFFSNSAQFWFGMQMQYDLEKAYEVNGEVIRREVSVFQMEE